MVSNAASTVAGSADATPPSVDSRWWYWVLFQPVIAALIAVFAVFSAIAVVTTGSIPPLAAFGTVVFFVLALLFSVMTPIAVYFDTAAIDASDAGWNPDQLRWTLFTVILPIQAFVALYYLWKRHEHLGRP